MKYALATTIHCREASLMPYNIFWVMRGSRRTDIALGNMRMRNRHPTSLEDTWPASFLLRAARFSPCTLKWEQMYPWDFLVRRRPSMDINTAPVKQTYYRYYTSQWVEFSYISIPRVRVATRGDCSIHDTSDIFTGTHVFFLLVHSHPGSSH